MKILVTGHRGFIGKNMVTKLMDHGHEVIGYEWGDSDYSLNGIDRVIHLGAISSTTEQNTSKLLKQNVYFSYKLVDECVESNIPIQIASSASVYGTENTTFKEDDFPYPVNFYSMSKLMVEDYCMRKKPQGPIQLFRYFNVYGPHEDHKGQQASPYHQFTKQAKETGVIKVFEGSENFKRDFVSVTDIVNTHIKFFNVQESGVWNIGTGECKSFLQVAEEVSREFPARIETIPMPENLKRHYQAYTKADITKLHKTLKIT